MTNLTHLKHLSGVTSDTGIKFLTPAAYPGHHCPLHTSLAIGADIEGMSTLVVGTSECGVYSRNMVYHAGGKGGLHYVYVLDASEVVFGCRDGLMEAIRQMDREGARAITLIMTCIPEVIGEDIEGIISEIQPELQAKLLSVRLGHFKCNSYPSGFYKTLEAYAALGVKDDAGDKTVNILGRSPMETHIPEPDFMPVLRENGVSLRLIAPKSSLDDFTAAAGAALNLAVSPYFNAYAKRCTDLFGIPAVYLHECLSSDAIDQAFQEISRHTGIPAQNFDKDRSRLRLLEERAKEQLDGKTFVITGQNALSTLPFVTYLTAFGMKPLLLHLESFDERDKQHAKALVAMGIDPPVCHMVNDPKDAERIAGLSPDIVFGELPLGGSLPVVNHLYEFYGYPGYRRSAALLERIVSTLGIIVDEEGK